MIITLKTKLMSATSLPSGEVSITASAEQAETLVELLQLGLQGTNIKELRIKFHNEQGYMESDDVILRKYDKHKIANSAYEPYAEPASKKIKVSNEEMVAMRTSFWYEEGYMQTDEFIKTHYGKQ